MSKAIILSCVLAAALCMPNDLNSLHHHHHDQSSRVARQFGPGYDYSQPSTPQQSYIPPQPSTAPPQPFIPPTTVATPSNLYSAPVQTQAPLNQPGMPFDFKYSVQDDSGNDFSHDSNSDGNKVTGSYKTLLPDGRVQVVNYVAGDEGYNAVVSYEGEATVEQSPQNTNFGQAGFSNPSSSNSVPSYG